LLLQRYGNLDYFLKMPFRRCLKFIELAYEKKDEELLFEYYLLERKFMITKQIQFMSWGDYKSKNKPNLYKGKVDNRSTEEIMKEILEVESKLRKE
jgi:hypothetical protein